MPKLINSDSWMRNVPGALPRKKRTRKAVPKVTEKEAVLQKRAEAYLDIRGVPYIRLPDTLLSGIFANPHISPQNKKFISSFIKGLPDIVAFHPKMMIKEKYRVTLPIEIKTERGKMSQAQKDWQRVIGTIEVKGWEEIKKELDEFLAMESTKEKK